MANTMKKDILLASCFGLGKLPWAPGTWASLPPVILYQVLGYLGPAFNVHAMGLFVALGIALYLSSAESARRSLEPQAQLQITAHKLAGQALTLLIIALLKPIEICNSMAVGFALFRIVDIAAARQQSKQRSASTSNLGILMSALAAGTVAGILSVTAMRMWPAWFD